jgi:hypothetical protein
MKTYWGVEVQFHAFWKSVLDGRDRSASRPGRFIPGERAPGNRWTGGWDTMFMWIIFLRNVMNLSSGVTWRKVGLGGMGSKWNSCSHWLWNLHCYQKGATDYETFLVPPQVGRAPPGEPRKCHPGVDRWTPELHTAVNRLSLHLSLSRPNILIPTPRTAATCGTRPRRQHSTPLTEWRNQGGTKIRFTWFHWNHTKGCPQQR